MPEEEPLISSGVVARRLGVKPRTITRWVTQKGLKPAVVTRGGQYRFRWTEVLAWLREAGPPAED